MNFIIKYLLKYHYRAVMDAVVADYLRYVPSKVSEEAITILAERRSKVEKLIAFQAYTIQRKMVLNPKFAELHYGMLIQLKLFQHLLSGTSIADKEEDPALKPASYAEQQRVNEEAHQKALAGVAEFMQKKSNVPTESESES